ncbi:DUF4279 domain-containing protein [Microbacterium sp. USHLN272]|jgi:hypothetical protein|uniref:DUF4279 domain-containing protein n=1 Tax=Microbacterium sp. USHLN272 TaxID=3081287 RepID=UPI0030159AC8
MIQSGLALFVVRSMETPLESITEVLGIQPTGVIPRGTVLRSGRVQECNVWCIDSDRMDNTEDDRTGTVALRWLLDACRPAAGRVPRLPADCETRIWWTADSDSTQGGFVLPVELMAQIAALGVDLYTTVNLDDRTDAEREAGA